MKKKTIDKIEIIDYEGDVYNLELVPNHEKEDDLFWIEKNSNIISHNCHPRDNIALSWLSRKLNLSYDWFENIMLCREKQTEWLAELIIEQKKVYFNMPIVILGMAFKKGTNLTVGSPSILLKNILNEKGYSVDMADEHVEGSIKHTEKLLKKPSIFFIGTNHDEFGFYSFPEGSVVIDPWRIISKQEGIKVISIGEK